MSAPVVIVGWGSIGRRHAEVLKSIGAVPSVVTGRDTGEIPRYGDLEEALALANPVHVVIANSTTAHAATLELLNRAGYSGNVLIEKPVFHKSAVQPNHPDRVFVGYNLRFHPVIERLRELLQDEKPISALFYVGQYLPSWRPDRDYRETYSSKADEGGGVLRDLSHELDLSQWLLGAVEAGSESALTGKLSSLEIDSEDSVTLIRTHSRCAQVAIQMNYLDRIGSRFIRIVCDRVTIHADLVSGFLQVDRNVEALASDRNESYRKMLEEFLGMSGARTRLCSFDEGMSVMRQIWSLDPFLRGRKS